MPTAKQTGTTTTDGTEQTLGSVETSNINAVLVLDCNAMANGDTIEVRIYTKALSGGTSRLAYLATYSNAQAKPVKYSVPVPANIEFKATIKRTAGTDRAYDWAILQL
jgi:hypothetical protein